MWPRSSDAELARVVKVVSAAISRWGWRWRWHPIQMAIEIVDFPMKNGDFPMKNGALDLKMLG